MNLTKRQLDVCKYLITGSKNIEIAHALNLSKHTVKAYISEIILACNAKNRTNLAYILGKENILLL